MSLREPHFKYNRVQVSMEEMRSMHNYPSIEANIRRMKTVTMTNTDFLLT